MIVYFKNFPLTGIIRLAFGVFLIVMGLIEMQKYIAMIGGILLILTFINKERC